MITDSISQETLQKIAENPASVFALEVVAKNSEFFEVITNGNPGVERKLFNILVESILKSYIMGMREAREMLAKSMDIATNEELHSLLSKPARDPDQNLTEATDNET